MTDLPIAFSGPMVRAILAGNKTETRRLLAVQPSDYPAVAPIVPPPAGKVRKHDAPYLDAYNHGRFVCWWDEYDRQGPDWINIKYIQGDRLYVREAITQSGALVKYLADGKTSNHLWPTQWRRDPVPPMHMFKRFSRITLTCLGTKVERLHDITDADALAEGIKRVDAQHPFEPHRDHYFTAGAQDYCGSARSCYALLWETLHGRSSWALNPWVRTTKFTVEHGNIDALPKKELAA